MGSMEQQNMLLLHGKGSKYFLYCTFYFRYIVCTIQIWKKSIINCMLEKKMFLLKLSWWSCTIIHNNMIIQHFSLYNRQSSNILSFTDLKTSGYVVKTNWILLIRELLIYMIIAIHSNLQGRTFEKMLKMLIYLYRRRWERFVGIKYFASFSLVVCASKVPNIFIKWFHV